MRAEVRCQGGCNGDVEFYRASGDVECRDCGKLYRDHPYCAQSKFDDWSSQFPSYCLHVLCSGEHVKL